MNAECKSTEKAHSDLISEVILEYPPSAEFRVDRVLAEHPELGTSRRTIIKLLLEEYCRRHEDQEAIDIDEFVRRYPGMEDSLRKEIGQHSSELARQKLKQPNWPTPDSQFHDWRLRRLIGEGGFSRVYLADEPKVGNRPVALKLTTRGRHECDLVGRLNHPGICQILSVRDDGPERITAIAMPYHGEATLHDVIEQFWHGWRTLADDELPNWESEPRSPGFVAQVVTMAVQLCDALEYAHQQGVLHCDLKPSNILIKPDGSPILLDFNLAFSLHDEQGVVGGTMGYIAPEQLRAMQNRRESVAIDARADVFGLGAVLYHALCGSAAFVVERGDDNDTRVDQLQADAPSAPPRPLTERNPGITSSLSDLIARCLEFDPQRRPDSIREVRDALAKLLPAPAPTLEQVAIRPPRRLLLGLGLAGAVTALAVVAGIALSAPEEPVAIDIHQEIARLRLIPASAATASERELLAYYLCLAENWQEAKEVLVALVDSGNASIGVQHNLAYCEMQMGGAETASQLFLNALEADPSQGKTWAAFTYHDAIDSTHSLRFPYRDYLSQTRRYCEDRELAQMLHELVERTTQFQLGRIREPLNHSPDGAEQFTSALVAIADLAPSRWLIAPDDFPSGALITQVPAD